MDWKTWFKNAMDGVDWQKLSLQEKYDELGRLNTEARQFRSQGVEINFSLYNNRPRMSVKTFRVLPPWA